MNQTAPAHVPPHLVRDIDPWVDLMSAGKDVYARAADYHQRFPPTFWAKSLGYLGGCWVTRRAEDLRRILQDPETFSSDAVVEFSHLIGETWRLAPLEFDPPMHGKFRTLLNPLFAPKRMAEKEADMQLLASELISGFAEHGRCDFNAEFASQFPILIYLRLVGWPLEEAPKFADWARTMIKAVDPVEAAGACRAIVDHFRDRIAEARSAPKDDLTSYVVSCEIDGRKLTDDEALGMCFLLFTAGLDTVTSSLAFQFLHLARHPDQQAQLRANPEMIPAAVEELLRAFSIVNMRRRVTKDVRIGEVQMLKGDYVMVSTQLANLDPEEFERPTEVNFSRVDKGHVAFSYGPHRCLGSHLARRELTIALREWLARIPPFRLVDEDKLEVRASSVFGLDNLILEWDAPVGAVA